SMARSRFGRAMQRGFTLAEMIAVVAIVSVLSVLAVYGARKYVFAAKSSEAIHMIGLIKAAQETYRDETFSYLPVSDSLDAYYPHDPTAEPQKKAAWTNTSHGDYGNWRVLGVQAD